MSPARIQVASATLDELAPAWHELAARMAVRLPFDEPAWHRHWWNGLSRNDRRRNDEPRLLSARLTDGTLVGVAPLVTTTRPGRVPGALRSVELVGADANLTELRRPIIDPHHEASVVTAWLDRLDDEDDWDVLVWSGVPDGSVTQQLLAARRGVAWGVTRPMPMLPLPDSFDEFRARLSRNTKEALRKSRNAGPRAGRRYRFAVHAAPVPPVAIDRFLALHWERSTSDQGVDHPDYFADGGARTFLREVLREDELGPVVLELWSDDRVVASRLAFVLGDDLYLYFSGFALDHGCYSVMTALFEHIVRWAIDEGLRTINLSPGLDRSKLRWRPEIDQFHDAIVPSGSLRSRLAGAAFRGLVEYRQRSYLTDLGADGRTAASAPDRVG